MKKENEVLLTLLKDFTRNYNSNSLSKVIGITPRGTLNILKKLKDQQLLICKQFGKAVFYKINFGDEYAVKLLSILLMKESKEKVARWIFELEDLFKHTEIVIIFGSVIKNPKKAKDIDLLVVFKREKYKIVHKIMDERRLISTRPFHLVKQTPNDLIKNLKNRDEVLLNVIRNGYVLCGYDKLVLGLKNVTSF